MVKNKKEFIDRLSKDGLSISEKIEACQYYIDNYPVNIRGIQTSLPGIVINGGSNNAVNHAFNQLKSRIKEFSS